MSAPANAGEIVGFVLPRAMIPNFHKPTLAIIASRVGMVIWVVASPSSAIVIAMFYVLANIATVCLSVYILACGRILVAVTFYARDNLLVVHSCGASGKVSFIV